MKLNNLIQLSFFAVLLCISTNLKAVGTTAHSHKTVSSIFDLPAEDILKKDKKQLETQIGRKLQLKEKVALVFAKRKMKKSIAKHGEANYEEGKTHGLAIASLVLGIVGFFFAGFVLGILAIIFGAISLKKIKRSGGFLNGKGMAIAGLVLGIIIMSLIFGAAALSIALL